jgi:hypothetical protein
VVISVTVIDVNGSRVEFADQADLVGEHAQQDPADMADGPTLGGGTSRAWAQVVSFNAKGAPVWNLLGW